MFGIDDRSDAALLLGLGRTCKANVVLPLDSGPKISMIRPRGIPWPPKAMSKRQTARRNTLDRTAPVTPKGMIAPSPNCFSICCSADFKWTFRSRIEVPLVVSGADDLSVLPAFFAMR
jgi:hypothetical protein